MYPSPFSSAKFALLVIVFTQGFIYSDTDHTRTRTRIIEFNSKLTKEKKGYNLVVTTFNPTKFKITINGHKIRDGQSISIPVENNHFLIRYDYEFKAMFKTFAGYREVEFEIDPCIDRYAIDFSWKHDNRFIINHARFIKITKIYEPGSEHAQ